MVDLNNYCPIINWEHSRCVRETQGEVASNMVIHPYSENLVATILVDVRLHFIQTNKIFCVVS